MATAVLGTREKDRRTIFPHTEDSHAKVHLIGTETLSPSPVIGTVKKQGGFLAEYATESEFWRRKFMESEEENTSLRYQMECARADVQKYKARSILEEEQSDKLSEHIALLSAECERAKHEAQESNLQHLKAAQQATIAQDSSTALRSALQRAESEKQALLEQHARELDKLRRDVERLDELLRTKENEILQQREIVSRLRLVQQEVNLQRENAEKTGELWRMRASSAEREAQAVLQASQQEKHEAIAALERSHSLERRQLEEKVKSLTMLAGAREQDLSSTQLTLVQTQQKQKELEVTRLRLQNAVAQLQHLQRLERSHFDQTLHTVQVEAAQERGRLVQDVQAFRAASAQREEEARLAAQQAQSYAAQLAATQVKEQHLAQQNAAWAQTAQILQRERAEALALQQAAHEAERRAAAHQTTSLMNAQERNVRELSAEAVRRGRAATQHAVEAAHWRRTAAEVDHARSQQLRAESVAHAAEVANLYQRSLRDSAELGALNQALLHTAHEAEHWRRTAILNPRTPHAIPVIYRHF